MAARRVVQKVYAYITHGGRLLVFRHPHHPDAGIQVPGGTVEPGEALLAAAVREAFEETGLQNLVVLAYLGMAEADLAPYGLDEVHQRHYYHMAAQAPLAETWRHFEIYPSDGGHEPIEFEFFWARFPDDVPELSGGQGQMLDRLTL